MTHIAPIRVVIVVVVPNGLATLPAEDDGHCGYDVFDCCSVMSVPWGRMVMG